jgi:flagellar basal-body rod modification protein FlgD
MTTVAPTPAAPATGISAGLTQSSTSLANNFETFLTLLTAQLRAQDPLNPMDTNEFTQQLVQFSGVEQQIRTNQTLEQMMALSRNAAGGAAVSYLGRSAIAETNGALLGANGASWTYTLPRAAESVRLVVQDERGRAVFTTTGPVASGKNDFAWDGKDGLGRTLAPGVYRLIVDAKGPQNAKIDASILREGTISQIDLSSATPMLMLEGVPVPLDNIKQLKTLENVKS